MIKVAYIGGTFDMFHAGHVNLLKRCHEIFDFVVVALNNDAFCEKFKRKPIMTFEERKTVIESSKYVDRVVENFGNEDSSKTISALKDDMGGLTAFYIVHGDDWTGDAYMKQLCITQEWMDYIGAQLVYLPYTKGISTTDIIKRVCASQSLPPQFALKV